MSYQSEAKLEENLMNQLVDLGYEKVTIPDIDALERNFIKQLSKQNADKLNGKQLTEKEIDRIFNHVKGKSIFDSAKVIRDKFVLKREDETEVYLEFFNTKDWCKNNFQVATQITVESTYTSRFDVTILINGLPMVQIELKRRGGDMTEAFNQINRYKNQAYIGLFCYIQIFVISNGVDTKYYANSDRESTFSQTFFWTDAENKRITTLDEFAFRFLEKCHIAKMIARYMVVNQTEKMLMVMRPYQVYAVESLIHRALETNNNGYIWHTTGSGKTLTSFKSSQILASQPNIKKVFFLVDRKDLDSQTIDEFNKFEPDSVDTTDKTSTLVNHVKDINKPLIVTTIQKMANAVKSPQYAAIMNQYKNEKVVFIIDECHRSQFGDMHRAVSRHFQNAQYFGFTGTPRLQENKSQDGRVTADLFEKCLHTYLIKDAIKDENVLGFSVEYIKTFNGQYDEEDDTKVAAIDTDEVFMNEERINMIANHIVEHHALKTRNQTYTAIFTVKDIPMLVKYYDTFKKLKHHLKVAAIFSYGANEESEGRDEHSRESLDRFMRDYNEMFQTNYSTDTFGNYFSDVSKKVKTAKIDILLVVRMFLTGFDSKTLNTLYVDKNLVHHELIQAYSRTNRIEKSTKPYGNIVCYRNLKKNTDDAIKLFSQTDNADTVLIKDYAFYQKRFKEELDRLFEIASTPENVDLLECEEDQRKFVVAFRELSKVLLKLQTFIEFEFKEEKLGISSQLFEGYKSKYLYLYDKCKRETEKVSILSDIDFSIELMHTDKINVGYIMNLIRNLDLSDAKKRDSDIKDIMIELDHADNEELRLKVELLKNFLTQVVPQLSEESSIDDEYNKFESEQRKSEMLMISEESGLTYDVISDVVSEYEYGGTIDHSKLSDQIQGPLLTKRKKIQYTKDKVVELVNKFN